jgi:hypothetical protein
MIFKVFLLESDYLILQLYNFYLGMKHEHQTESYRIPKPKTLSTATNQGLSFSQK